MAILRSDKAGPFTKNELTLGGPIVIKPAEQNALRPAAELASRREGADAIQEAISYELSLQ